MISLKRSQDLKVGDVMALPFNKTATIVSVKVGTKYVTADTKEFGPVRLLINDEVQLEVLEDDESSITDLEAAGPAYVMLGLLQGFAPNGDEQQVLSEIYSEAMADSPLRALRTMTNILSDGLEYGNWPWTTGAGKTRTEVPKSS